MFHGYKFSAEEWRRLARYWKKYAPQRTNTNHLTVHERWRLDFAMWRVRQTGDADDIQSLREDVGRTREEY